MSTSSPLTWTSLRPEDAGALAALANRIHIHDGDEQVADEPSMREWLTMPGLDLQADTVAVRDGDELVAYGAVSVSISTDRDGRVRTGVSGGVAPEHRRGGIGTRILELTERRGAQLATERHPGRPAHFRAFGGIDAPAGQDPYSPGGRRDARALLERRGYRRARSWSEMAFDLTGTPLPEVEVDGVEIIAPGPQHREPTRLAHVAAFADHWGSTAPSFEQWAVWWSAHTARTAQSAVAVDPEGTVLGYAVASEHKPSVLHLVLVGTRPEARGRGIARAVIARSLRAAADAGYQRAELEVDSESLTGAGRLYESLGFTVHQVSATYEKPITPPE
ncbi:GNAT family N-acetyltransferase [Brachybacterium sp. p3-SID1565]|uniref:GNAT family N-acetyltransferase n=1 Tax=Brachybacterium TaxID=43668 RepID=UPI0021A7D632|nr:GNAT family N-acetyltransferase [Brachybacterium sp. p3-SID1565]MCT1384981.1 GNAT family N-acetyltransferase [Brachybacterium sp. p3-SID1565]